MYTAHNLFGRRTPMTYSTREEALYSWDIHFGLSGGTYRLEGENVVDQHGDKVGTIKDVRGPDHATTPDGGNLLNFLLGDEARYTEGLGGMLDMVEADELMAQLGA